MGGIICLAIVTGLSIQSVRYQMELAGYNINIDYIFSCFYFPEQIYEPLWNEILKAYAWINPKSPQTILLEQLKNLEVKDWLQLRVNNVKFADLIQLLKDSPQDFNLKPNPRSTLESSVNVSGANLAGENLKAGVEGAGVGPLALAEGIEEVEEPLANPIANPLANHDVAVGNVEENLANADGILAMGEEEYGVQEANSLKSTGESFVTCFEPNTP